MKDYQKIVSQLHGTRFLTDAGLETDLIFNHGMEIREFAAHTLFEDPQRRAALTEYLRAFLNLARESNVGFILDSQTWRASMLWAKKLNQTRQELEKINHQAIDFIADLRKEFSDHQQPIILNGVIGPSADAYAPETLVSADAAQRFHTEQIGWLADTDVEMLTALTFTQSNEAIGVVRAAREAGLPVVVSFTVETDGRLPTGQMLGDAINAVDNATTAYPLYYMINCAHPDHFSHALKGDWVRRIRGVRCNASRCSHAELDESETLDDGDPIEFGSLHKQLLESMPWLSVFGGCCGSDIRHVRQIARAIA